MSFIALNATSRSLKLAAKISAPLEPNVPLEGVAPSERALTGITGIDSAADADAS